ncbi:MAG: tetratricopeptide repeat protein [Desulfuromonadales bacterium]|nr:tetratricopeptide repeat protein [Desulfuromonadales bacterium]
MLKKILYHPLSHLLLIMLIGFLAYANTFGVPFVLDDLESINRNEVIRDLGNYIPGGPGYDFLFRRWFGYFTFALNYYFSGLDVTGYHLFNLTVHICTALLVYAFVRLTFRTPFLVDSKVAQQAAVTALLAALFFVAHPVQTQAVTYTVQRLTSLCTLFYLLALVLYVAARLRSEVPRQESERGRQTSGGWHIPLLLAGSVVSAVLAMFTKEIAFTLPLAALLYEVCFFHGAWQRRGILLLPVLLTVSLIPILVLSDESLPTTGGLPQTEADIPRLDYLFTQFRVLVTYLRLLVLPVNQNLDYDYPVFSSFFTPPVFLSFVVLAALLGFAIHLSGFRIKSAGNAPLARPELRLIAFGIFWFFLTLAVESSFIPIADVIFEHRLYLPSIGVAVAMATAIILAREKTISFYGGKMPMIAAAMIIIALTLATWQRNKVWQNEVSLWGDVARKSPQKHRPWFNLGTHLMTDSGQPEEAIPALLHAVARDPGHAESWHNLGSSYLMSARPREAIMPLRTAVRLKPDMADAAVNLAVALIHNGNPLEAVPILEEVGQRLPQWPVAHINLGIAYVGIGKLDDARRELAILNQIAPQLAPTLAEKIKQAAARDPVKHE